MLHGARQSGKTTLARAVVESRGEPTSPWTTRPSEASPRPTRSLTSSASAIRLPWTRPPSRWTLSPTSIPTNQRDTALNAVAPGSFRAGVLLHTGEQSGRIGERLYLRPINCLWAQ